MLGMEHHFNIDGERHHHYHAKIWMKHQKDWRLELESKHMRTAIDSLPANLEKLYLRQCSHAIFAFMELLFASKIEGNLPCLREVIVSLLCPLLLIQLKMTLCSLTSVACSRTKKITSRVHGGWRLRRILECGAYYC